MTRTFASTIGLLVLLSGLAGATTVACSSSSDDGGSEACPTNPPTPGTTCDLPESTSCIYGDAGASACDHPPAYVCRSGQWNEPAEGAPQPLACPATRPVTLSACETTCGSNRSCNYGECDSLDCIDGKWQPEESFAACIPDSGVDASTDDASTEDASTDDAAADAGDGG